MQGPVSLCHHPPGEHLLLLPWEPGGTERAFHSPHSTLWGWLGLNALTHVSEGGKGERASQSSGLGAQTSPRAQVMISAGEAAHGHTSKE